MRKILLAGAVAAGVAAATVLTGAASATSAGEGPLRLTATAAAVAFVTLCRTCVERRRPRGQDLCRGGMRRSVLV